MILPPANAANDNPALGTSISHRILTLSYAYILPSTDRLYQEYSVDAAIVLAIISHLCPSPPHDFPAGSHDSVDFFMSECPLLDGI